MLNYRRSAQNERTITNVSIRQIEYDTIRDAILTCAQKLARVSLICRTEPTTRKKWKTEKLKSKKTDMLILSIGKQSGESVPKKKSEATVVRIGRKGRF